MDKLTFMNRLKELVTLSEAHWGNRWTVWCYFERGGGGGPGELSAGTQRSDGGCAESFLTAETRRVGFQRLSVVLPAWPLLSNWCFQCQMMSETPGVLPRSRSAHIALWQVCSQTRFSSEEKETKHRRDDEWPPRTQHGGSFVLFFHTNMAPNWPSAGCFPKRSKNQLDRQVGQLSQTYCMMYIRASSTSTEFHFKFWRSQSFQRFVWILGKCELKRCRKRWATKLQP